MDKVKLFRLRRQARMDSRGVVIDKVAKDGGPGSGNWNHVGRLHKRGGSAPAGTIGNFGKRANDKYYAAGSTSAAGHIVPNMKRVQGQQNTKTGKTQNNTALMWTNQSGGINEKRQAVYDKVADRVLGVGKSSKDGPSKKKRLTIVSGTAGSGKQNLMDTETNPRAVKLGGHQMAYQIGQVQNAQGNTSKAQTYEEAALHFERAQSYNEREGEALADALRREAMQKGLEIAYDTNASNYNEIRKMLEDAHEQGYECVGKSVCTDLDTSMKRLQERWDKAKRKYFNALESGKKPQGYPPQCPNFETVRLEHAYSVDTTVLTATMYDSYTLYDNNGSRKERHKIAEVVTDKDGNRRLKVVGGDKEREELQRYLDGGNGSYSIDDEGYVQIDAFPDSMGRKGQNADIPADPITYTAEPNPKKKPAEKKSKKPKTEPKPPKKEPQEEPPKPPIPDEPPYDPSEDIEPPEPPEPITPPPPEPDNEPEPKPAETKPTESKPADKPKKKENNPVQKPKPTETQQSTSSDKIADGVKGASNMSDIAKAFGDKGIKVDGDSFGDADFESTKKNLTQLAKMVDAFGIAGVKGDDGKEIPFIGTISGGSETSSKYDTENGVTNITLGNGATIDDLADAIGASMANGILTRMVPAEAHTAREARTLSKPRNKAKEGEPIDVLINGACRRNSVEPPDIEFSDNIGEQWENSTRAVQNAVRDVANKKAGPGTASRAIVSDLKKYLRTGRNKALEESSRIRKLVKNQREAITQNQ